MVWIGMRILRLEAEVGGKVPVYEKITNGRYRKNVNFVKVRAFLNPLVGQTQTCPNPRKVHSNPDSQALKQKKLFIFTANF